MTGAAAGVQNTYARSQPIWPMQQSISRGTVLQVEGATAAAADAQGVGGRER